MNWGIDWFGEKLVPDNPDDHQDRIEDPKWWDCEPEDQFSSGQ